MTGRHFSQMNLANSEPNSGGRFTMATVQIALEKKNGPSNSALVAESEGF